MDTVQAVREYLGARVRASRRAQGWTAKAMGQRMGKSEATVSRIERGKQRLGVDDLTTIAGILGVAPGDLLPHSLPTDASEREAWRVVRRLLEDYRQEVRRTRQQSDVELQRLEEQMQRALPTDMHDILTSQSLHSFLFSRIRSIPVWPVRVAASWACILPVLASTG